MNIWWAVTRASGIVAWAASAGAALWGLALSGRIGTVTAAWKTDLHRILGAIACGFTALHLVALVADSTVDFGLAELAVPFASSWHASAVAWGVVGMYLLALVEVSSLLRRRLTRRTWRRLHMASYGVFVAATAHYLTAGTDGGSSLSVAVIGVTSVAVGVLTVWRIVTASSIAQRVLADPR